MTREQLHHLVDQLPDGELSAAERFLRYLRDLSVHPAIRAALDAPLDDEPLTEGEKEALAEAEADTAAGRLLSHDELKRELGL